jgi:hypothetical protein
MDGVKAIHIILSTSPLLFAVVANPLSSRLKFRFEVLGRFSALIPVWVSRKVDDRVGSGPIPFRAKKQTSTSLHLGCSCACSNFSLKFQALR